MNTLRKIKTFKPKNYWFSKDEFMSDKDIERSLKVDLNNIRTRFTLFYEPDYARMFIRIKTYCPKCGKTLLTYTYKFKKEFTHNTIFKSFSSLGEFFSHGISTTIVLYYNKTHKKYIQDPLEEDLTEIFNTIINKFKSILSKKHVNNCKRSNSLIKHLDLPEKRVKKIRKNVLKQRLKSLKNAIKNE